MSRAHLRKPTRAQLEAKLAKTERELNAYFEWFHAETRGDRKVTIELTEDVSVQATCLTRNCGGVVVVVVADRDIDGSRAVRAEPEFLDDALLRWSVDRDYRFRHAARQLIAERNVRLAEQERQREDRR